VETLLWQWHIVGYHITAWCPWYGLVTVPDFAVSTLVLRTVWFSSLSLSRLHACSNVFSCRHGPQHFPLYKSEATNRYIYNQSKTCWCGGHFLFASIVQLSLGAVLIRYLKMSGHSQHPLRSSRVRLHVTLRLQRHLTCNFKATYDDLCSCFVLSISTVSSNAILFFGQY
jgi:hypothetical protein